MNHLSLLLSKFLSMQISDIMDRMFYYIYFKTNNYFFVTCNAVHIYKFPEIIKKPRFSAYMLAYV